MGAISCNGQCLITNLPAVDIEGGNWNGYEYKIKIDGKESVLMLSKSADEWYKDPFFCAHQHIISGILLNHHWTNDLYIIDDIEFFKTLLAERTYPKTNKVKMDFLFQKLFKDTIYDGQVLAFSRSKTNYYDFYFSNQSEFQFYLDTLSDSGLIKMKIDGDMLYLSKTFKGLSYSIELENNGNLSNNVFVAMSFNPEWRNIRNAIKQACNNTETKYNPIIVDEIQINSEVTINDAIIANLKKCKFCIADFTEQKDGVYFECGYALGQGKKVIYTCHEDWFNGKMGKCHFDTDHFPHIIYHNADDLTKKLIDRINAWV